MYKISQNINPKGLAYFTTPLQTRELTSVDSELFFIVAYFDHLAVFNKSDQSWTIYTVADGYPFVHAPITLRENYRDKFVLAGSKTNEAAKMDNVIIFDKITKTVSTLRLSDYKSTSSLWQKEDYKNKKDRWYIGDESSHPIIRHDLKTNKKTRFSTYEPYIGRISTILTTNSKFYVAYKNGIGAFNPSLKINPTYRFPLPQIKTLVSYNEQILASYDSAVEVFDKDLNSRQYINLGEIIGPISFNDKYIFYTKGKSLNIKSRSSLTDSIQLTFNADITKLKLIDTELVVFSPVGYSTISTKDFKVKHYLQSNFDSASNDAEYGYGWIGSIDKSLIGYYGEEGPSLVAFSLDGNPSAFNPPIGHIVAISHRSILEKKDDNYLVYEVKEENKLFKILEFKLKEKQLPNAFHDQIPYPIGSSIHTFSKVKEILCFATDKGLFFYDLLKGTWRSHFITDSQLHAGRGLLVTDNSIYSFGETYANAAGFVSKIDRKTYNIVNYSSPFYDAYYKSIKIKGDELICANENGIVRFNFKSKITETFALPEPISQTAFYKNGYLAVNGSSIYLIGVKGEVLKRWPLQHQLIDPNLPSPKLIELDGEHLWINSIESLVGQLTLFSLKSGGQFNYYFQESYGTVQKIINDSKYTWIFGHDNIYRYNKETSSLQRLGLIEDLIDYTPERTAYINDAIDNDSVIYIASYSGIFQLHKESLAVKRCSLPYLPNYYRNIAKDDSLYFVTGRGGVFQIDALAFESSFTGGPTKLFNYFKENAGILLPYSYDNTIRVREKNLNQLFYFNLEKELTGHKVLEDFMYPEKYLKFLINGMELKMQGGGMSQVNPIATLFHLSIPSEVFQSKKPISLQVLDRTAGEKVLKEWKVILE